MDADLHYFTRKEELNPLLLVSMATAQQEQQQEQPHEAPWGTWVMGKPVPPSQTKKEAAATVAVEHVSAGIPVYKNYSSPAPPLSGRIPPSAGVAQGPRNNPYVQPTPVPGSAGKSLMEMILKMLDRCGKKLEQNARKAGNAAGNVWQHLRTSPKLGDAAMARLSQGTKLLAEGGHEKIFQRTFGSLPGEQLRKAYACYLSTSTGPVIGTIYISTARLAFCSNNPLCHNLAPGQQEWVYYKVIIPLDLLKAVNPSSNPKNPAEKYIQTIATDNHEFWFMGFVSYDKALKNMTEALKYNNASQSQKLHH